MAQLVYHNFDLTIKPDGEKKYKVHVDSRGGQPVKEFEWPFSAEEMVQLWESIEGPARHVGLSQAALRRAQAEFQSKVRIFGERAFDTVFADTVLASFATSLQIARQEGAGLRVRLHLDDVPELAQWPWEYLYNSSRQLFLALAEATPLVRYLRLDLPSTSLLVKPPLNILVMIADPNDYPRLDVEQEWKTIQSAFEPLQQANLVHVERLQKPTVAGLTKALAQKRYNVFHFIGHGDFDEVSNESALLMERDGGQGDLVGKDFLRVALQHDDLRLVVLNSCEGAKASKSDPFTGLAQSLVQNGIPAAIAMQFKITDGAANTFAAEFYGAIVNGHPIDTALGVARRAIFLTRNPTEWATPILFLNTGDGQIFQIDLPTEEQLRQRQIEVLTRDARAAIDSKDYVTAIQKLQAILELQQVPLGQPVPGQ